MPRTGATVAPKTPRRIRQPDPLIPSLDVADEYVGRKVEGAIPDFTMMDYALDNLYNVLLEGPTGCGKTMMLRAYAATRRMRFGYVQCNIGVEPSQFFGRLTKLESGDWTWVDGIVPDFLRNGGLLVFNEINFLPDKISTALFSLFDDRRNVTLLDHNNEVVSANPQKPLLLVADCNPEYLGTRPLNEAFRNRFPIKSVWDYDPKIEYKLLQSKTLIDFANKIRGSEDVTTPVSTNMLQEFVANFLLMNEPFAVGIFVNTFATDERATIRQLWEIHKDDIRADLQKLTLDDEGDEGEEFDADEEDVEDEEPAPSTRFRHATR